MSDKVYIGRSAIDLNSSPALEPISMVRLVVSEDAEYVSGDDSGRTIEVSCPWGTQAMADDLLASLGGYSYQPLDVQTAFEANPLWELGDGVTVGGLYSQIAGMPSSFGLKFTADVNAPDSEEINHEYPYQDKGTRAIDRKIAQTRASLRIDVDAIEARVDGLDGDFAALDIRVDGISSEVSGKIDGEEAQSLIDQTLDEISLSVSGTNGTTTFKLKQGGTTLDTETFDLHVKSVNIEGTLTAEALRGRTVSLLDSADDVVGSIKIAYTTTGDGLGIYTNHGGIRMESDGNVFITSGYNTKLLLDDDAAKIGPTVLATDGHIIYSSDRNVKHDIEYDIAKYRDFLLSLKPCRFKFNDGQSGRYHIGLIAQDVEQSLADCGIDSSEFSGWCRLPIRDEEHNITGYTYGIRYDEIIPLNTMLIQELIRRVDALERQTAS